MTHVPQAHEVETFTGRFVDIQDPDPDSIDIEDIAHALGNTCRYGGHSSRFYSVAEHAVICAWYANKKWKDPFLTMACLHHDDAEAYLGDIPRPIKSLLGPAYKDLTQRVDRAIYIALNLPVGVVTAMDSPEVHEADNWALMQEARRLLPSKGEGWAGGPDNWEIELDASPVELPPRFPLKWTPAIAENAYLVANDEAATPWSFVKR